MDLNKLSTIKGSEQGFEFQLTNPSTGDDLGIFITVLGRDSEAYTKLLNEQSRKRVTRAQRMNRNSISLDELDKDTILLMVACTKSWRQGDKTTLTVDGEELECSRDNVAKLYREYPWIKEQVEAAVMDRSNFLTR